MEYEISGSASGILTEVQGASHEVQQGYDWTQTTDCPRATYTETATYELAGSAANGYVWLTGATNAFDGHENIESIEIGTCDVVYLDHNTNQRSSGTKPNKTSVLHVKDFGASYHADHNWEYRGEDNHNFIASRWRRWIHAIETMPCILSLTQNPVLVLADGGGHTLATLPAGSDYQWAITAGGDRARVGSGLGGGRIADIEISAVSQSSNDIAVTGTYVGEDGVRRSCVNFVTAIAPKALAVVTSEVLPFEEHDGEWLLGMRRKYRVLDQFGAPIQQEGLEVTERLRGIDVMGASVTWDAGSRLLSFNPNDITLVGPGVRGVEFLVLQWWTDPAGEFFDAVQFRGPRPPDQTDFLLNQEIFVDRSSVGRFVYHFLGTSVAVAPQ
jgi:hypothetical protein